jgi:hypothetical protein
MPLDEAEKAPHPLGERASRELEEESDRCMIESYAGKAHIRWDDSAAVTAMGQMPVFIDFLKTSGLWDGFVAECPLRYTSPDSIQTEAGAGIRFDLVVFRECQSVVAWAKKPLEWTQNRDTSKDGTTNHPDRPQVEDSSDPRLSHRCKGHFGSTDRRAPV